MPYSVEDARDLLIASVLCNDPVMFIDDRWLYDNEAVLYPVKEIDLRNEGPKVIKPGSDVTIVGCGYSTDLALKTAANLLEDGISAEIIIQSVEKTGVLSVVDGGWKNCGIAGEVISSVVEKISPKKIKKPPLRITLPHCPAPTASNLEKLYYPTVETILPQIRKLIK
jgi:pyruvate/2-oxoglutarate/acetoin dehydrogenase E1 component